MINNNYLIHFGTKGQKWGIRNYQNSDGSYTSKGQSENSGHGRYYSGENNENETYNNNQVKKSSNVNKENTFKKKVKDFLNDPMTKKALIAGGVIVGSVAAYKVGTIGYNKLLEKNIRQTYDENEIIGIKGILNRQKGFNSLNDIPKTDKYSHFFDGAPTEKDIKNLLHNNNGGFDEESLNNLYKNVMNNSGEDGVDRAKASLVYANRTNNCVLNTASLAMRLKGYDTCAQTTAFGYSDFAFEDLFDGSKTIRPSKLTTNGILSELKKSGVGSYGNLTINWKSGGAHSILYTVCEDGIHILDGQMGVEYDPIKLFSKVKKNIVSYARLDNCKPNEKILNMITDKLDPLAKSDKI